MSVIARAPLRDFWMSHADAEDSLKAWLADAEKALWQSPNDITANSANTSILGDSRVCFNIKSNRYFVCPVDHIGLRKYQGPRPSQYQGPEPFWLCGRFKSFYNGTNIVVQVFPDPLALLVGCALLSLVSLQAVLYQSVPLGELLSPLLFARVFCCYAILAFPVSFKAFLFRKTLERLLA